MIEVAEAEALYTTEWWRSRSNEQLHEMLRAGLVLDQGAGAHRELERRARELAEQEERQAQLVAGRKKVLRLTILGVFLLATLLALLVSMLMR